MRLFLCPEGQLATVRNTRCVCKKVLILRNSYNFRKASGNLAHLLGVANLMSSNHLEPFVDVQHAEKSVRPAIRAQIAGASFFQKRQGAFANGTEFAEHIFFVPDQTGIERNGGFPANDARFNEPKWQMTPLQKGNGLGSFLRDAIGAAQNGTLEDDEMGDEFRRRPRFSNGLRCPSVGGYGIGGAKEGPLGFREFVLNAVELLHARPTLARPSIGPGGRLRLGNSGKRMARKGKNLERRGAGLLQGMRQLKNLCFAKGRAEDLEAHRERSSDAAARHGDARETG